MKTHTSKLAVSGMLLLFGSPGALAQGQTLEEAQQMLEKTRSEIAGMVAENASLREKLTEHEMTIAEYREMIESLDQEIEKLKQQLEAAGADNG